MRLITPIRLIGLIKINRINNGVIDLCKLGSGSIQIPHKTGTRSDTQTDGFTEPLPDNEYIVSCQKVRVSSKVTLTETDTSRYYKGHP